MALRKRPLYRLKRWAIYHLDQFVASTPIVQIPVITLATAAVVSGWAIVLVLLSASTGTGDSFWWALTRFADGGTMAADQGGAVRLVAVGVTASGVLLLSFLTGAFASKLSERIDELRTGRSPVVEHGHVLLLGFDAKVPSLARELAHSHQRLTLVTLAEEDKARQEAILRSPMRAGAGRLRVVARTGDPRSEIALTRVAAPRARSIVLLTPPLLSDEQALRFTLSTLLALRRVLGPSFRGRIVVDARRSSHQPLLLLSAEAGLAGPGSLPVEIVATDDVIARVLAQSVRHGGVYLTLRELLSFRGSEFHLEKVPRELVGKGFEEAHSRIHRAVAVGVLWRDGGHTLVPEEPDHRPLQDGDRLIVLERDEGDLTLSHALPAGAPVGADARGGYRFPQTVAVLGYNHSLAAVVTELDRVMHAGSRILLSHPPLPPSEAAEIDRATQACRHVAVERFTHGPEEMGLSNDKTLEEADGAVILGCEDEHDPDGDASAVSLLLRLRQRERREGCRLKRLVTEVRDPTTANQIEGTLDDFLVSTDVVAMMLAQAALNPALTCVYRDILDPGGTEIFIRPLDYCATPPSSSFAQVMAGARARGEIAIGYLLPQEAAREGPRRQGREGGARRGDEAGLVRLNPARDARLPAESRVVVLANWKHTT
jgi:hypothetical protein